MDKRGAVGGGLLATLLGTGGGGGGGSGLRLRPAEVVLVLACGAAVGVLLGYILMGTAHAMYEIGAVEHYRSPSL